jgi:hypothetical protein
MDDPFEPNDAVFKKGPHAGELIDISYKRSVHVLSTEEAAPYKPAPGELLIANFRHDGRFWIARVPADAVEEVIFQVEHFPNGKPLEVGSHNQLRFVMKPGRELTLVPQVPGDSSAPVKLRDFIYSAEAIHAEGAKPFDPASAGDLLKGTFGEYGMVYRAVSVEEKLGAMIDGEGRPHPIEQHRLKLEDADRQKLLRAFLADGSEAGLSRTFNTMTRNCTTELVHVFDAELDYGRWRNFGATVLPGNVPQAGRKYMGRRGLIGERLPDLFAPGGHFS